MNAILTFIKSSIGRKFLMAFTGILLVAFIIIHMLGNMHIFFGKDELNHYAKALHTYAPVIWGFRLGLLAIAAIHIWSAISLARENKAARPVGYENQATMTASLSSVTMVISGLVILAFVIFHILHFTTHNVDTSYRDMHTTIEHTNPIYQVVAPVEAGQEYHDVYRMVIAGFSVPWISGFYIVAMALVCMHLSHGVGSIFQSLGLRTPALAHPIKYLSWAVALIIFIGMSSVPVGVLLGYFKN